MVFTNYSLSKVIEWYLFSKGSGPNTLPSSSFPPGYRFRSLDAASIHRVSTLRVGLWILEEHSSCTLTNPQFKRGEGKSGVLSHGVGLGSHFAGQYPKASWVGVFPSGRRSPAMVEIKGRRRKKVRKRKIAKDFSI